MVMTLEGTLTDQQYKALFERVKEVIRVKFAQDTVVHAVIRLAYERLNDEGGLCTYHDHLNPKTDADFDAQVFCEGCGDHRDKHETVSVLVCSGKRMEIEL